ncbi:amidohydrolase family protein [Nocardia aobensis]|uniref:Amidohydrolase family protein n=1 Tax=Nocardia aobensis TaxID=257277 RepID=A0ABW6P9L5_9NOCA
MNCAKRDVPALFLRRADLFGHGLGDCRLRNGLIAEIGPILRPHPDETVIDCDNGALLPGLADHHLHLAAMAAAAESFDIARVSRSTLATVMSRVPPGPDGWVRVVGYDDETHGFLDRYSLDEWRCIGPVRVQHRSGALWVVDSDALRELGADTADHPGVERDELGRPTGRLWRADSWLRETLGGHRPDMAAVSRRLVAVGITHVADASPDAGPATVAADAVAGDHIVQHVMLMAEASGPADHPRLAVGPVKIVVADHDLPELDTLVSRIRRAHAQHRSVALHCVSRVALALTLAALRDAGHREGDRIEHCAVADDAALAEIAALQLRVITQPTLVARRGDDYWARAEPQDRADLWRYGSLLRAGIRTAPSSDAPYGDPDPWFCLRAAATRRTASGRVLGSDERVEGRIALRGMLSRLSDPGGAARRIERGHAADLVLLDPPLRDALLNPRAEHVRGTFIMGEIRYDAGELG